MRLYIAALLFFLITSPHFLCAETPDGVAHWPAWRGPDGSGISATATPPLEWSEEKNILWKVALPGKGHATPAIWGERVFVLSANPLGQADEDAGDQGEERGRSRGIRPDRTTQYIVQALDRQTGKLIWEQIASETVPHEGTHLDATWASLSPVTDGERLYASFGSRGIFCYSLDGKLLWNHDPGDMRTRNGFGEGSSPTVHGDVVIINWDHEDQSFILALNKYNGKTLWKVDRDEPTSWSTPRVVSIDGREQVVVSATNRSVGYDLKTGEEIWFSTGMTTNTIPTPIISDGRLFLMSGFRGNALQAIRLSNLKGDITGTNAILWEYNRDTPYVPSGIVYGNRLYFTESNKAILTCLDAGSGEAVYPQQRLEGLGTIYASPVAANKHIYITSRNGSTLILKDGSSFEVVAKNQLEDHFSASPALAGNQLFLRGEAFLYCIAAK